MKAISTRIKKGCTGRKVEKLNILCGFYETIAPEPQKPVNSAPTIDMVRKQLREMSKQGKGLVKTPGFYGAAF